MPSSQAYRYINPVPNATAKNWGGAQGHAAGNTGTGTKNIGADYLAPYGSSLYAPVGGTVVQVFKSKYDGTEEGSWERRNAVNENYGWGSSILIKGDDGFFHRLSHVVPSSLAVKQGQRIDAGQQVAQVGQSGNTIGNGKAGGAPHLDWEKFSSKTNDPLGHDRVYEDPRAGAFEEGGQQGTSVGSSSQRQTRYAGEHDARGGLNRAALSPAMRQWAGLIEEKADKYGVPPELLAGIVDYESGGKPDAGHPTSGATGLGQVMPKGSGPYFNDRPTKQELLDPDTNLEWSAKILAANYKKFNNNPQSAAAAYLGAVDAKGNPTTAADANGTNGFKYIQEVMGRAEKFAGTGPSGPSERVDPEAAERAKDKQMASDLQGMLKDYGGNLKAINDRIKDAEDARKATQTQRDKDITRYGQLAGKPQIGPGARSSAESEELAGLMKRMETSDKDLARFDAVIAAERDNQRQTQDSMTATIKSISGEELTPSQIEANKANAEQSRAAATKAAAEAALIQPGQPGYQEAQAKADLTRKQAELYEKTVQITQQNANTQEYESRTGRQNADTNRLVAGTQQYNADTERMQAPAIIARNLAAAGVDEVTAQRIVARMMPELDDLRSDTKLKTDQAAYQRAITDRTNKLVGAELGNLVQTGRLTQAQADKAIATLPADIAAAEQTVRQGQATTGLTQAQTWAQVVDANTKQFEAEMKSREAEVWQQVQKIASNPNASDEDIMGAIQAGARNATEAAQVYQTKINQYQQTEASRHNKVAEGIDIQNADETERNNRYQNLASIQNSRANMQNASTNAVGPRLGATGMANAMAGLGMVTGSAGLNRLAMQSGTGASVIDPVKAGLAPFEKDQETLRAGVRDNRLANPNATGTEFKAPKATAATAGIGSAPVPKINTAAAPTIEGVNFKNPSAAAAAAPAPDIALPPPAPAPDIALPVPTPPPPPPEEEEEGGGGGKRPGGGGVRVVYSFKPPKANASKKSTAVAANKPAKAKGGGGGGFRVPGRIAS